MLAAEDGSELSKIHKVRVLRNERRQGDYVLYTASLCLYYTSLQISIHCDFLTPNRCPRVLNSMKRAVFNPIIKFKCEVSIVLKIGNLS